MIRVSVDDYGTYSDLIVRIDGIPTRLFEANTGWLYSFWGTDDVAAYRWSEQQQIDEKRQGVARLIRFWQELLTSGQPTVYLLLDLADQSGSALQIVHRRKAVRVRPASTVDLIDGTSQAYFLRNQASIDWRIDTDETWDLALTSIMTGLNWSLAQLQLPIVPLRYE